VARLAENSWHTFAENRWITFGRILTWLIEPIRSNFSDSSESIPAFEAPIVFNDKDYKLALFVDNNGLPEYARLTICGLQSNAIPQDILPLIQVVKEHLLSVLRVMYHPDANLFPRPIWTFIEENVPYKMGLEISQLTPAMTFNPEKTHDLFVGSFPHREELRLFIDGQDSHIPLQYRYLSLYKILELHFKDRDKWLEDKIEIILQRYEDRFRSAGIERKPLTHIHILRNKCAHFRTRGRKDTIGVTHLHHKEAAEVERILPILTDICVDVINERAKGRFQIQRLEKTGEQLVPE
jgi:hypothetical protein